MFWNYALTSLLTLALMMLLLFYYFNYFKAVFLAFKLSGPPSLPLLGNVHTILDNKKMEHLGNKMTELYGPIVRFWISVVPFFFITEPADLQVVLSTNKCSTKNFFYSFMHNFLGDGLITNSGEKWKSHRKLIQPYFNINILKVYFDSFCENTTATVKRLENQTDVNVGKLVNKFVLDVLYDTVLGISINDDEDTPFRKGKVSFQFRITKPWLLLDTVFRMTKTFKQELQHQDVLQNYTKSILQNKRKNTHHPEIAVPNNLMEIMIQISNNNPEFTVNDIVDEISTFMLAGQDSVGAALAFSLYFLAAHEDIQNKVVDELDSIFKNSDRVEVFEDIAEMNYLEQCIKEAMRLCPSVPIISRILTKDVVLGKYVLPQGTNVFIAPFVTHRLPHIFLDPLKYDPDRFAPENKAKMHPYAYLPFSAGPRNCVGYKFALIEMKTVISRILRNYHLSLCPGHEELNLSYRITLRAKGSIWLRIRPRK